MVARADLDVQIDEAALVQALQGGLISFMHLQAAWLTGFLADLELLWRQLAVLYFSCSGASMASS